MPNRKFRRSILLIVNVAVSAALLAFVVTRANFTGYTSIVSALPPATIGLVIGIIVFQIVVISAWRLKLILAVMGSAVSVIDAARVTWCGFFVEQVGAIFITGDIARILLLRQASVDLRSAIEGPLLDRAIGLGTIAVMASVGMPHLWQGLQESERHLVLVILASVAIVFVALATIVLFSAWWAKIADGTKALSAFVFSIVTGLARPYSRRRVIAVVMLAFATHSLNVVAMYLLLGAVGVQLSIITCFMFAPTVFAISMLPTSISGWGVREGALVVALSNLDLPPERVITASLLFGSCVLLASLPGAVIWLSMPRREA